MARSSSKRSADRLTGQDAVLKFDKGKGFKEIPVTNVSWTRDTNTTEIQDNQGLNPVIATTGVRFSGSFEYDGRNDTVADAFFDDPDPVRATLMVRETDDDGKLVTYRFKRCLVTSQSKDYPSDDVVSATFDFVAEDLSINRPSN